MLTQPIHPIDKKRNRFLLQFHDANNYVVGICPLYVLGFRQTGSGTQVSVARGGAVDVFNVKDLPSEVANRLDEAFEVMEDSFVASFLRNDVGAMEDRLQTRITQQLREDLIKEVTAGLRLVVRDEVATMAALDAAPSEPEKVTPKKKAG
jgi:hypothetical protein